MRKIIANNIKNYLGRKVNGSVKIRDNGKTLFIRIVYKSFEYSTKIENLSTLVLNGYTSNDIGYNILKEYELFLHDVFFK